MALAGYSVEGSEEDCSPGCRRLWAGVPGEARQQVLRLEVPEQGLSHRDRASSDAPALTKIRAWQCEKCVTAMWLCSASHVHIPVAHSLPTHRAPPKSDGALSVRKQIRITRHDASTCPAEYQRQEGSCLVAASKTVWTTMQSA